MQCKVKEVTYKQAKGRSQPDEILRFKIWNTRQNKKKVPYAIMFTLLIYNALIYDFYKKSDGENQMKWHSRKRQTDNLIKLYFLFMRAISTICMTLGPK